MKCAVCGNEFGNGANCQSCGVDRVTGLGNYIGYDTPMNASMDIVSPITQHELEQQTEVVAAPQNANVGSMACYACGEIIPADSKFCPYCSRELYVACPKCGNKYSSQFPACNQCGTNREKFLDEEKKVKEKNEKLKIESVVIPDGSTIIPPRSYEGCDNLKSIMIPSSVRRIGEGAFSGCRAIEEIVLPASITEIGSEAFSDCWSLKKIVIPHGLKLIEDRAFYRCSNLQKIELPNTVTSIGDNAFDGCLSLKSLDIPDSIETLGYDFLEFCDNLEYIGVANANHSFSSLDGVLFSHDMTTLIKMPQKYHADHYVIPDSVTSIFDRAISSCSNLKSLEIPTSVTSIGEECFCGCGLLRSVFIPNTLKGHIDEWMFDGCSNLNHETKDQIEKLCGYKIAWEDFK